MQVHFVDDTAVFQKNHISLSQNFQDSSEIIQYVTYLLETLRNKGYVSASADSLVFINNNAHLWLFSGKQYPLKFKNKIPDEVWIRIRTRELSDQRDWPAWQIIREKAIGYYEQLGYPFAEAILDSMYLQNDTLNATAKINPGVKYHIDSIRLYGKLKLRNCILQKQTGIFPGSLYDKGKLDAVDQRLSVFSFAKRSQPSDVSFLGTGGILNVYMNPQKCSQLDLLLGLQPASGTSNKAQLVGNAQLDLKNSFGNAERIFAQWQQLQFKSPRINLSYAEPFIFGTSLGAEFQFGLFKKDSSFLQLRGSMALSLRGLNNHKTSIGFNFFQNNLLEGATDTNRLILSQKMPDDVDSRSMNLMLSIEGNTTNEPENPRRGWQYQQSVWVGTRKVISNQTFLSVKGKELFVKRYYDSVGASTYQVRYQGTVNKYFPLGNYSVILIGSQLGFYKSKHIFRTDLFQIGGNRILRGFDEESIFANKYAVFTAEYRLQLSERGYTQLFSDIGFVNNTIKLTEQNTRYVGIGIGMAYPTDNGRLSISLAVGKRSDVPFLLRQSARIHLGYINYF